MLGGVSGLRAWEILGLIIKSIRSGQVPLLKKRKIRRGPEVSRSSCEIVAVAQRKAVHLRYTLGRSVFTFSGTWKSIRIGFKVNLVDLTRSRWGIQGWPE
jgi:hypothetical protein